MEGIAVATPPLEPRPDAIAPKRVTQIRQRQQQQQRPPKLVKRTPGSSSSGESGTSASSVSTAATDREGQRRKSADDMSADNSPVLSLRNMPARLSTISLQNIDITPSCYDLTDSVADAVADAANFVSEGDLDSVSERGEEESWLVDKLADLLPQDFHPEGVLLYTTSNVAFPPALESISRHFSRNDLVTGLDENEFDRLVHVRAVIIFCDVCDNEETLLACALNNVLLEIGDLAPPTFFVPHMSANTRFIGTVQEQLEEESSILQNTMNNGMDAVIPGDIVGFALASAIRSEIISYERRVNFFERSVLDHMRQAARYEESLDRLFDGYWDYLRVRMNSGIPTLDDSIAYCASGVVVDNFRIGKELGGGGSGGIVYALEDLDGGRTGQVLKAMRKEPRTNGDGICSIRREIKIMHLLSGPKYSHEHIIQLHQVYHSNTHIMYRMQDGGSNDLYRCLRQHELAGVPLGRHKAELVIGQVLYAISHMHLGPKIMHADIKPENIIVHETEDIIHSMLCDFDLSRVLSSSSSTCSSYAGTFPFMAPEMLSGQPYLAFPTDIWSVGIVFAEVKCYCGVLMRLLNLPSIRRDDKYKHAKEKAQILTIAKYLAEPEAVRRMIDKFHAPDLGEDIHIELLEGLLAVNAPDRMTATDIVEFLENRW